MPQLDIRTSLLMFNRLTVCSDGQFHIDTMISYSTVCGTGTSPDYHYFILFLNMYLIITANLHIYSLNT